MEIISQTLAVVQRTSLETGELELVMGVQKRGPFQNQFNFPGGKSEPGEFQQDAAAREVAEETGIFLLPEQMTWLGKLLLYDKRPGQERFGTVAVFGANVPSHTDVVPNYEEFECFWINPKDRNILLSMPSDVRSWLPLIYENPRRPFSCHITTGRGGGCTYETYRLLPGQRHEKVDGVKFNL
jgi:8-oxo-dGTP pyrophosphatase MutT (NUDIX family)